jgi:hypothetical protein
VRRIQARQRIERAAAPQLSDHAARRGFVLDQHDPRLVFHIAEAGLDDFILLSTSSSLTDLGFTARRRKIRTIALSRASFTASFTLVSSSTFCFPRLLLDSATLPGLTSLQ